MSFDSREQSLAAGAPVRLYEFRRGVWRWLYNSSDRNLTVGPQVYLALPGGISDGGIRQSGVARQDDFVITAPADLEVAQLFRNSRPSAEIALIVSDMHMGDGQVVARYTGTIASVRWPTLDSCRITCQDIDASMERPGLVDTYSRTCTTTLYSKWCGVDRNLHRVESVIDAMAGRTITCAGIDAYPDGRFGGGYVEWPIGNGEFDTRTIETHAGEVLTLMGGTFGLAPGMAVRVYPGCDFLPGTCNDVYDNLPNFRGTNAMDGVSPFDGDQVF